MAKYFLFFVSALIVALVQATVLPALMGATWLPQLLVVGTVLFSAGLGIDKTWKFILVSGVCFDILSFLPWGTTALALLLVGYLSSTSAQRLFFLQSIWGLAWLVVMSVLGTILYLGLVSIFFHLGLTHALTGAFSIIVWPMLWRSMLMNGLLTAVFYWPVVKVAHWVNRRILTKNANLYV